MYRQLLLSIIAQLLKSASELLDVFIVSSSLYRQLLLSIIIQLLTSASELLDV